MKLLAVDTETALIDRGEDIAPRLACVTHCDDTFEPQILHWSDAQTRDFLVYAYDECETTWANGTFDHWVLIRAYPQLTQHIWRAFEQDRIHDVRLRQRLIDLGTGQLEGFRAGEDEKVKHSYSLAAMYERYGLGALDKSGDTYRLRYSELIDVPLSLWPVAAVEYATLDAKATLQVHRSQDHWADLLNDGPRQAYYSFARRKMQLRGVVTDGATCDLYLGEVHEEIEKARQLLLTHGLIRGAYDGDRKVAPSKVGTKDMKRARARMERVCTEAGIEIKKTPKKDICLNAEATRDSGDPVLRAYSLYTSSDTVIKKVTMLKEGSKGLPLQSDIVDLKENGRCASRIPSGTLIGVQMHNLPKVGRMRNCVVPRPGYCFVEIDYAMHELVTVAQCQIWLKASRRLADALNDQRDVHCEMATVLMGVSYDEIFGNRKRKPYSLHRDQSKECFHPDTEILTPLGWRRIADVTIHDSVAQFVPASKGEGAIEWVKPLDVFTQPNPHQTLVHLKAEGIDLRVTPDHRMLKWSRDTGRSAVVVAEAFVGTGVFSGAGIASGTIDVDHDLLRLAVAVQADGSYTRGSAGIKLGFSKARKITRMRALLAAASVSYKETHASYGRAFYIHAESARGVRNLLEDKAFPWWWLSLTEECRRIVLEEAQHWDSHVGAKWAMYKFCSARRQNIDVLQALAAITGRKSRAVHMEREQWGYIGNLSVKQKPTTRADSVKAVSVEYTGPVVCLSVPSSFVLVRDGGVPVVTGQCNFGGWGVMSAKKLRARMNQKRRDEDPAVSLERATEIMHAWEERWDPAPYFSAVANFFPEKNRWALGAIRQFMSDRVRAYISFPDACNGLFSGLAADAAASAYTQVCRASELAVRGEPLYDCHPVLTVHDSIVLEVPLATLHESATEATRIYVEVGQSYTPDVLLRAEPAASLMLDKNAEPVYKNGELQLWMKAA